jgi:hypothetical protein
MQQVMKIDKGTPIIVEDPKINLTINVPLPSETIHDDAELLHPNAHEHDEFDVVEEDSENDLAW